MQGDEFASFRTVPFLDSSTSEDSYQFCPVQMFLLLLFQIALLSVTFRCLHGETRVKVKVMMKEYHVNGRDWDGKKCDYVVRTECDPMFLMCIDKPNR